MMLERSLLTIRVVDPEGKLLGTTASYWVPSPGDTIDGFLWPETLGLGEPVLVVAEVTHRVWLDDGIVNVEVEPI